MSFGSRLPDNVEQVAALLKDETWCISYVYQIRWPDGFICPACGRHHQGLPPDNRLSCLDCGKSSSLTSGTLMHASKKNLSDWLLAIWWLCGSTEKQNIRNLQHVLCLGSYQTAWNWMQKLRLAVQLAEQQKCRGNVEIDCIALPRSTVAPPLYIAAAIEIRLTDWSTGRVKMAAYNHLSGGVISQFLKDSICPGSVVFAPDKEPFGSAEAAHCLYTIEPGRISHENLTNLYAHFYCWYAARAHRPFSLAILQRYLAHFCFHINSALFITRQLLFEHLLRALVQHRPAPYSPYQEGALKPAPVGGGA